MFSVKKNGKAGSARNGGQNTYPVLYVAESLKEYQKELVTKEVQSLWELKKIGNSFSGVMEKADHFQKELQDLGESFSGINQTAEQFSEVRGAIGQTVSETRERIEHLKNSTLQVEESYSNMEQTFERLKVAVDGIQKCMGKIVSIADETNILAINASIEAARAGEEGKGFSIVAAKVRELAEEIKGLTGEVDERVADVKSGTGRLNQDIVDSKQTLGQNIDTVNSTYESFHQITEAAESAVSVQEEISNVIEASQGELKAVCQFFDDIRGQYNEVLKNISHASRLGTTKSAMFEDMDNLLSQIPPMMQDKNADLS